MKSINYIFLLSFSLLAVGIPAQTPEADSSSQITIFKERGFNMTPFLTQFVPLGKTTINSGPVVFQNQSIKNGRITRFGLGGAVDANGETASINIRFGLGKEIPLNPKWTYYRGTDLWLFAGSNTFQTNPIFREESAGIGLAPFIGIRYHLTPFLNLATETAVFFGVTDLNPFLLQIIPPLALFLNVRIPKDKLKRNRISILPSNSLP